MSLLKLIWRGVRDLFDQLLAFSLYSISWWICAITVVGGPPATVALFSMCDPRRKVAQPEFSDAIAVFRESFRRSWPIALITVPLVLILGWNVSFFAGSDHPLIVLVPLWVILMIILTILGTYAFSVAATMESRWRNAYRGATYILVLRPIRSIILFVILLVLMTAFTVMVIPMLLFGPALLAAIVNRFVLESLDVPIIDPDAPTSERQYEREQGINPDKGFVARLRERQPKKR